MPDAAQLPLHVLKLIVDGPKPLALLSGHAVHLLVHHFHQLGDVPLGEDVGANLVDDDLLESAGVEPGGIAGVLAALHDRLADVVGELSALGVLAAERPVARLALHQSTQQVGASHPSGMGPLGGSGAHQLVDPAELGLGDDGRERLLHPHRLGLVLCVGSPDQLPRFLIDTKNCGTRGRWAWTLLKVTSPRLLANNAPTASLQATLSPDVNVARAWDDYDSGELQ